MSTPAVPPTVPLGNAPLDTPLSGTPTYAQVFNTSRQTYLADVTNGTGTIATDDRLLSSGQAAYRVMYQALAKVESPKLRRSGYWRLPPYISYLSPALMASLGFTPIGAPISIHERADGSMVPITGLVPNLAPTNDPNPYVDITVDLTQASPTIQDGSTICILGCNTMTSDINDEWTVTIPQPNTLRLWGCVATPLPSGSSNGWIMNSPEPWPLTELSREQDMRDLDFRNPNATLAYWTWTDDAFRFRPATQTRQIRIKYKISPEPPTDLNTPLGVQGSHLFLSCYTAALFANSFASGKSTAQSLFALAVGNPAGEVGVGESGYLGLLTSSAIKTNQMARIVVGRFRPKRSTSPIIRS